MAFQLADIEENSPITIHISNNGKSMDLKGSITKHLDKNIAVISIEHNSSQLLVFDKVQVDVEYAKYEASPYIFKNCKIITHNKLYILQVFTEGVKTNRRDSFRVSIGKMARSDIRGHKTVVVRDISHSGFALTDRNKNLGVSVGDNVSIAFDDMGYRINLEGVVVRIEERENYSIVGLKTTNICKNLANYLSLKQRPPKW